MLLRHSSPGVWIPIYGWAAIKTLSICSPRWQQADPNNAAFNYMLGTVLVRNGDIGRGQIIIHQASPGSATITQTNSTFGIAQYKQGQRIVELQAKFFF
jgi:hypothetical protein